MFKSKKLNFIRLITASEIPFSLIFRKDVAFPHAVGIVMAEQAKIGKNVVIWSNIKIGAGALITKDVLPGVVAVSKNEQIILS